MPQLDFFLDRRDELEVVRFVLSKGGWFVPDLRYDGYHEPRHIVVKDEEAYLAHAPQANLFFILCDSFFESPLQMQPFQRPEGTRYFIPQRTGGPTVDFSCHGTYEKGGTQYIRSGMLGYYATYWNTVTNSMQKVPQSLRSFYHEIANLIKHDSTPITTPKCRRYWLGKHAREAIRHGAKLGCPFEGQGTIEPRKKGSGVF